MSNPASTTSIGLIRNSTDLSKDTMFFELYTLLVCLRNIKKKQLKMVIHQK